MDLDFYCLCCFLMAFGLGVGMLNVVLKELS